MTFHHVVISFRFATFLVISFLLIRAGDQAFGCAAAAFVATPSISLIPGGVAPQQTEASSHINFLFHRHFNWRLSLAGGLAGSDK